MRGAPSWGPRRYTERTLMKRKVTLFTAAGLALVVALIAAGCGSSTSGSSQSPGPYGSAPKPSTPSGVAGAANVSLASSGLGRIVVDNTGRTLYLFEKDKDSRSACDGQCATYWPPLLTHGKPLAQSGVQQSLLAT